MTLNRHRLYFLLSTTCLAGYAWLFYILSVSHPKGGASIEACLFKSISTIPCPSCGSTRAILALLNAHFLESVLINPMGIMLALVMLIGPVWILFDYATKGQTFFNFYGQLEAFIKRPGTAIPLVLLVILNWFWNIFKGL